MTTIRPELPADIAAIAALHRTAFPSDAEARLVDALRGAGDLALSLVACTDDRVVGHIAFSPVTLTDDGAPDGWGLAPVAVLPPWQRRGIAARLIDTGLAEAGARQVPFAVVLGEPAYYQRFGFRPAAHWGIDSTYDAGDAFMACEYLPISLSQRRGRARYAPAFAALS